MKKLFLALLATICTYKVWVEASRFAGVREFVKKECFERNLEDLTTEDKGWIRTTVFIKVRGDCSQVIGFKNDLYEAIEEYEKQ